MHWLVAHYGCSILCTLIVGVVLELYAEPNFQGGEYIGTEPEIRVGALPFFQVRSRAMRDVHKAWQRPLQVTKCQAQQSRNHASQH